MAPIAIGFGALLILLGGGVYMHAGMVSITALIPAFFGLPLLVLGVISSIESCRMHAMHGAALIGLVGFAVPAYMVISGLMNGQDFGLAKQEQAAMAVICLVFVGWCVKSFIDARRARKQKEAQAGS